jgi:hypothetical protein
VTKGSTGIRIWARCEPSQKRLQAWRATGADPDERPRATYTLVCVFAQDQVTELPPLAVPAPLTPPLAGEIKGDSHKDLIVELVALARQIDYTVQITDTGAPDGTCDRTAHRIAIAERLSANGRLATLIHELAHALVGLDGDALKLSYAQEELVIESAAWSCCQAVGLETSANSTPYLGAER